MEFLANIKLLGICLTTVGYLNKVIKPFTDLETPSTVIISAA